MRVSGIGAPEISAAKRFGQNKKQNRHRSRNSGNLNSDGILPPALDDNLAINIPVEAAVSHTTVDGEPLPLLNGWLRKRSRKRRSWDRRYFYVEPDEKRLYYLQNGPMTEDDVNHENNSIGVYQSLGKFISSTYHKIVDGDDAGNESFIDLRLIPDVYIVPGNKRIDKCCFDIDLGYRILKVKCETEAECRFWVDNLNKWREWAHSALGEDGSSLSSRSFSGYSTDGSQNGDSVNGGEEIRGRLPCEPESSAQTRSSEWTVVRRRNSKGRRAEEESRGSSIASDDSEYGSRHLENFLTSSSDYGRRVSSSDSVTSNAFASLSYYGSDSNSRSNSSGHSSGSGGNSRSSSRVRKFPGSMGRSSSASARISESYDTARGETEGRSSGSAWDSDTGEGGGEEKGGDRWFDYEESEPFTPHMSPIPLEIMSPISHKKNRPSTNQVIEIRHLESLSLDPTPHFNDNDDDKLISGQQQPQQTVVKNIGMLTPINLGDSPLPENLSISPMKHNLGKLEPLLLARNPSCLDQNVGNKNEEGGGGGGSFDKGSSPHKKKKGRAKTKPQKKNKNSAVTIEQTNKPSRVIGAQRASSGEVGGGEVRNTGNHAGSSRTLSRASSVPLEPVANSLKLSQVTRLPRPTDSSSFSPPSLSRTSSSVGSISQKWKDYPTQLNIEHDDDYGV